MTGYSHLLDALALAIPRRGELARLMAETPPDASIMAINPAVTKAGGISALALDFDGVLAHHGAPFPIPEAVEFLKRCEAVFGGDKIFILSNKPTEERSRWYSENFPGFRFISGVRKKPYPDGLLKISELAGVAPSSILMVDDRMLTGGLAAILAGARPYYVRRPYISMSHRPVAEIVFWLFRVVERVYVRLLTLF